MAAFGTRVKVTNLQNSKSVTLRVNDRGPTQGDRVGDVSLAAARQLGMTRSGVIDARIEALTAIPAKTRQHITRSDQKAPIAAKTSTTWCHRMNPNLLSLAHEALGGDFSKLAGQFLGESPGSTQSALGSLLPAVLGTVAKKGVTPQGASDLLSLINSANLDISSLGNIAGMFGGTGAGANALLKAGTNRLVPALFGDKSGALVSALSSASGIKTSSATSLLAMVVPLILTFLKKFTGDKGLNANSISSLLAGQGPNLQGSLDSRLTSALGFASAGASLSRVGGQAADATKRTGAAIASGAGAAGTAAAAAATATRSGLMRWLPWLIGAALVVFLWSILSGVQAPAPTPVSTTLSAPAPAPAPVPAAVAAALPAKVYFEVGAAALGADGSKTLAAVADLIKAGSLKVTLTGYTDKTGDVAKNEELAKSRSGAVRDALKAAGVPEASIEMKPPIYVEVGAAGGDAEARRVEIKRQ